MGQTLAGAWWEQRLDCEQRRRRQDGEFTKYGGTFVQRKFLGGNERSLCLCRDGGPAVHYPQKAHRARGPL